VKETKALWSVPRIKHPEFPDEPFVRVGELEPGGMLYVFFWDGKQRVRSLKVRRRDLGGAREQEKHAKAYGCAFIKERLKQSKTKVVVAPPQPGEKLTFGQLAAMYETKGLVGKTKDYRRDAIAAVKRVVAFLGEHKPVTELSPGDVQGYVEHRRKEGRKVAGRMDLVATSIAVNWVIGESEGKDTPLLMENPLARKKIKEAMSNGQHVERQPWYSEEQVQALQSVAHKSPPAFGVLVDLAWHTGRRIAAILGLKWQDVMIDNPRAAFSRCQELNDQEAQWPLAAFEHGGIRWYAELESNKKRRDHVCPINPAVRAVLDGWRRKTKGRGFQFLFTALTDKTRPLAYEDAKRWLRTAERLAKIGHQRQRGWHAFRRGWATARKGFAAADLALAQDWKDKSMPLHYQQGVPDLAVVNFGS